MNNKILKQVDSKVAFDISSEYFEDPDLIVDSENSSDINLRNLHKGHDLEVKHLIKKNRKLLAIVGHDIRNSISLIIGYLSLTKESIDSLNKKEIEVNIDSALFSAGKSITLLDSLLKWALAENDITSFKQEYIDIAKLVQEEVEHIKTFADQKQITLTAHNIPHIKVFIDENMIRTVFRNLLNNAIKYTFIRGDVAIQAIQKDNLIEVTVKDNGIGIKEDMQNMIFEPKNLEFALGSEDKSKSGFGLFICNEIIDLHKGQLWMTSTKDVGSEFKFTLPIS